jgi:hypothetical protein
MPSLSATVLGPDISDFCPHLTESTATISQVATCA